MAKLNKIIYIPCYTNDESKSEMVLCRVWEQLVYINVQLKDFNANCHRWYNKNITLLANEVGTLQSFKLFTWLILLTVLENVMCFPK